MATDVATQPRTQCVNASVHSTFQRLPSRLRAGRADEQKEGREVQDGTHEDTPQDEVRTVRLYSKFAPRGLQTPITATQGKP
jgi:hypothetical protein